MTADEAEALRAENSGLQVQIKKLNRRLALLQSDIHNIEKLSATRDKLASVMRAEQSKQ